MYTTVEFAIEAAAASSTDLRSLRHTLKCGRAARLAVTTERECLDALREGADRLGESPSKAQYERLDVQPSSCYSRERLRDEIAKCITLCANCHRKEHYQPPDGVDRS